MDIILKIKYSPAAARLRLQSVRSTQQEKHSLIAAMEPHPAWSVILNVYDL